MLGARAPVGRWTGAATRRPAASADWPEFCQRHSVPAQSPQADAAVAQSSLASFRSRLLARGNCRSSTWLKSQITRWRLQRGRRGQTWSIGASLGGGEPWWAGRTYDTSCGRLNPDRAEARDERLQPQQSIHSYDRLVCTGLQQHCLRCIEAGTLSCSSSSGSSMANWTSSAPANPGAC
jgi:hypothetical protein